VRTLKTVPTKPPHEPTISPGDDTWFASDSPTSSFSAVFEDNGETGYFYACERSGERTSILDAVHIYNVRNVIDREIESRGDIVWSSDGLKAALLLNGHAHAVIDFSAQRAYCRLNFPPPGGAWRGPEREPWDDSLMRWFGSGQHG
jgi:hypothetical protein